MSAPAYDVVAASRMLRGLIRDKSYQQTRLGAAVAEYLAWAGLRLAPRSKELYELYLAHLCALLAEDDPAPADVTTGMLVESLSQHGPPSRRLAWTSYNNFFKWAKKPYGVWENPVDDLPRLRERPDKVYEVFTLAEQARILKATDEMPMPWVQRLRALIFVDLGVRREEAQKFQVGHFDVVNRVVVVENGKGGKERIVPAGDEFWRALLTFRNRPIPKVRMWEIDDQGEKVWYRQDRLPLEDDFVFFPTGGSGSKVFWTKPYEPLSLRGMQAWWQDKLVPVAGIKYRSLHMNRHTVGTSLADAGAPLDAIQDWLGHADPGTTKIYMHNSRGRLSQAREQLDRYRQGRG